jgi:hypothetical protein
VLLAWRNATGGESSVSDVDGDLVLTTTLSEPRRSGVGDDRRTLHRVSPIRLIELAQPAQREVLVITFAPSER